MHACTGVKGREKSFANYEKTLVTRNKIVSENGRTTYSHTHKHPLPPPAIPLLLSVLCTEHLVSVVPLWNLKVFMLVYFRRGGRRKEGVWGGRGTGGLWHCSTVALLRSLHSSPIEMVIHREQGGREPASGGGGGRGWGTGRAHAGTPVPGTNLVCRSLLEKKKNTQQ